MNYQDYAAASKQPTTNNHVYYQPISKMGSPFTITPVSTTALSALDSTNNGYIIAHQNTPSVITYSTNTSDTTTVIDTSSYSFSNTSDQNDDTYSMYQHHYQQQQEDGTLSLDHMQMVSPWQNQAVSTTSMIQQQQQQQQQQQTDPHFTTLNNDDDLMVPLPERGVAGFVCKLYQSLEAPDGGEKYARWMKHNGKDMFIIDCIPKFTETVLPKLFKHCKFASFVRQLNIYGFQRDTDARKSKDSRDKEICRWYHTHFRPGRRDLFHLIRRKAPRYSRRKRIKMEQDDEKVGSNSGEESDQDNGDDQASPSITSSATTPTMANNSINMVYCSSPSSMFRDHHTLIDTSPMMLSPPPPPPSSSSTAAISTSPPPPSKQQQQPCDQSSSSALPIQAPQQQEPSDSPSSLLPIQSHQQQEQHNGIHQQIQDQQSIHQQQQQDQHIIHQQQHDQHNIHNHTHHHSQPQNSLCLSSPLNMNNALIHGNSTTNFSGFLKGSSHQPEHLHQSHQPQPQSHQLDLSQKPPEAHSLQQSQQFEQQFQQLQHQQFHQMHQHQHHQQQRHHILSFNQDPNMYNFMLQVPPPPPPPLSSTLSSSSPSNIYQEELKAHISRLQNDYQQMHAYFTNELGKAHKQIEIQRLRTEFLERSLRGE